MTKDAVAGRIRRLLSMADRKAKQDGIPDTESAVTPDLLDDALSQRLSAEIMIRRVIWSAESMDRRPGWPRTRAAAATTSPSGSSHQHPPGHPDRGGLHRRQVRQAQWKAPHAGSIDTDVAAITP